MLTKGFYDCLGTDLHQMKTLTQILVKNSKQKKMMQVLSIIK